MGEILSGVIEGAAGAAVAWDLHLPREKGRPLVFICHGFKGFKDWGFFPDLAQRLASSGYAALRFNYGHNGVGLGASATEFTRLDLFEQDRMSYRVEDLRRLHEALVTRSLPGAEAVDVERLGIFGHSMGGAVAIIGQHELSLAVLVTLASIASTAFPPEQAHIIASEGRLLIPNARTGQLMPVGRAALEDVRQHADRFDLKRLAAEAAVPWLLVHGSEDTSVPVQAARELHAAASSPLVELDIIPGADHTLGVRHPFSGPTPAYERFVGDFLAFLDRHLDLRAPGPSSD